jgi:hypothetical protein
MTKTQPNKPLHQTGHAIDGRARYDGSSRVSRLVSVVVSPSEVVMRLQHKAFEPFADRIGKKELYGFFFQDRGLNLEAVVDDTDEGLQRRIWTECHRFYIGSSSTSDKPGRGTPPLVEVEVHDTEPVFPAPVVDFFGCITGPMHPPGVRNLLPIVEASVHLPTGQLRVHESTTGRALEDFRVEPGWYRVRWFDCGREPARLAESEPEQTQHFLAVLWPAPPVEQRFLR